MDSKKKLLVVAHAPSPNTLTLRNAVAQGAGDEDIENVEVTVLAPLDAGPDDILACDAILLGTTENLGYMSGALKDFFDRSYYPCLEKTQGLPFAYYIRAGHDGTGTQRAIESITTGLRWKLVQEPLICRGEYRDEFEGQCRELGMYVAASLDAGLF
ncbi:flavodoxin family protein [Marinobacter sp. 2_MG-2023]|uniref:flavodoxin family protein n=1 Tax=Marinobacter sp. 2_MG-2023 TaxID=3062679 RepID=UPI0026E459AB|nr:flavodoxin family protein [Marinobacter sp. 2_MG-2023]MDO6440929.1 flavodoxin family protein [Marinobacter sp. 2_MG-2023]